jgi:hypothetical protein
VAKWRELRETGLETAKRTTLRFIQNPGNQKMLIGLFIGGGIFGMSAFLSEQARPFNYTLIPPGIYNTANLNKLIRRNLASTNSGIDIILRHIRTQNINSFGFLEPDLINFVILNDLYRTSLENSGHLKRNYSFESNSTLFFNITSTNSKLNVQHYQELIDLGLGALWGFTTSVQFYAIPKEEINFTRYAHSEFQTTRDTYTDQSNIINIEDFHLAFLNYITGICVFANDLDVSSLIRNLKNAYFLHPNISRTSFWQYRRNYQCFGIRNDAGYYIKLNAGNIHNIVDLPHHTAEKRLFIDTNILISLLKYDLQTKLLALNSQGGLLRNDPDPAENQYSQSDDDVANFMQNLNTGAHNVVFLITDLIFEEFITTSNNKLTEIITSNGDTTKPNKHGRLSVTDVNLIQSYVQKLAALRQSFAPILSHTNKFIFWNVL